MRSENTVFYIDKAIKGAVLALFLFVLPGALAALFLFVSPPAPHPAPSAPVAGPQCTAVYPRGYTAPKITKKHPVCDNGIFGSTWRGCELRYQA